MRLEVESITNQNAEAVAAAGEKSIRGGDLVVDFGAVKRCDTAALACILAWLRVARERRGELSLVALPQVLSSLAKLYRVEHLLGVI